MPALLEVDRLKIDARKDDDSLSPIVKSVSFNVQRGEVVALIGESGSGKTTIALSALGYCKPGLEFTGGEVRLHGRDVISMPPDEQRALRGQRVAYLAQSAAATFNPALTIGEQVTESPVLHGQLSREKADIRAEELYRALELPDPDRLGKRYPHQVSGGQLQRLMAAMALCGKPDLLVLDEPTTALDVTTQIEVLKAFKSVIKQEGAAAIYVTHDLSVVAQIADHIVVLYAGDIQEQGTADQIINRPGHDYTRRLMAAVRPPPAAGQGDESLDEHRREAPALEVRNVTAGYGRGASAIRVLSDVNVSVQRGHTVGVIGESGCGKSTLARVMSGLLPAREGEVLLDGDRLPPSLRRRRRSELQKIQFVFQMADTALNPRQRIDHILGRPLEFYLGLRGAEKRKRLAELLDMVELPVEFAGRYPEELSGGQKQRVNLARALAASPEVLLCDEVISALDTIVGANVIELAQTAAQADRGVVRLHQPRSLHHRLLRRRDRGALRGKGGRAGEDGPRPFASVPPLYTAADRVGPGAAHRVAGRNHADPGGAGGHRSRGHADRGRVSVLRPLPARDRGHLRPGDPTHPRPRRRAHHRVSSQPGGVRSRVVT